VDLADLSGVFVRYAAEGVHQPNPGQGVVLESASCAERQAGLSALWEHLPCPVINRMAGGFSNHSKPYQLAVIHEAGLAIPRTLVTSDPASAAAFVAAGTRVIFKSLSGVRSIVRCVEAEDVQRFALLRNGPAQFQEYVPGCNVRVHTVDTAVFATRVRSDAVDYRYAEKQGASIDMEPATLPPAVERACLRIARKLRLTLAGIDLKETPDGRWYCFEVNPVPMFAFYEQHTGQPISAAIADVLRRGREARVENNGGDVWNDPSWTESSPSDHQQFVPQPMTR
jgi:glutathione synthase/RimK-type ligase-like ATP-grasp enzyme